MYKTHETLGRVYQLTDDRFVVDPTAECQIEHKGKTFTIEGARLSKKSGFGKVAVVRAREDGGVETLVFLVNAKALR